MENAFVYRNGELTLAKQKEPLPIRWSRRFSGIPRSVTVRRDSCGRYFVSILVEETIDKLPFVRGQIGIDLGLLNQVTDQRGNQLARPNFSKKGQGRQKKLARAVARKCKGSKNRQRAKQKLARHHAKIRDRRIDFLHKLSWQLVNENQVIVAEDLAVQKLMQEKKLSRSIADAGWATLLGFLEYKCRWYGKTYLKVDRFFPSSKLCSSCGFKVDEMPLQIRQWSCPNCSKEHDRDTNAATNILREGLRMLAATVPGGNRDVKPVECV